MKKTIVCFGLVALGAIPAFGWGKLGHQSIAVAAVAHLKTSKQAVQSILANSNVPEIKDAATAASWPDDIKPGHALSGRPASKDFNRRNPGNSAWHFVNCSLESQYSGASPFKRDYDIVQSINACVAVLEKRPGAKNMSDVEALAFLMHLVGDLHQPLHIACGYYKGGDGTPVALVKDEATAVQGLPHDVGGNNLVWGDSSSKFQPEFHAFWDDKLVELNGSVVKTVSKKINSNWATYARTTSGDYHTWAAQWATEGIAIANKVYVDPTGLDGKTSIDTKHGNEKVIKIDLGDFDTSSYEEAHGEIALQQLVRASVDLAALLDSINWPTQ